MSEGERLNFHRLSLLILDGGTPTLKWLFEKQYAASGDLEIFLKSRTTVLDGLHKRKIINLKQMDLLRPSTGIKPSVEKFDTSLLITLLTNLCPIQQPNCGWSGSPAASDLCPGADILRVRDARNNLFHHAKCGINDAEFQIESSNVSAAISRLSNQLDQQQQVNIQKIINDARHADRDFGREKEICNLIFLDKIDEIHHLLQGISDRINDGAIAGLAVSEASHSLPKDEKNDGTKDQPDIDMRFTLGENSIIFVVKLYADLKKELTREIGMSIAKVLLKEENSTDVLEEIEKASSRRLCIDSLLKRVIHREAATVQSFLMEIKSKCPGMANLLANTIITEEDRKKFQLIDDRVQTNGGICSRVHTRCRIDEADLKFFQDHLCYSPENVDKIADVLLSKFYMSLSDHSRVTFHSDVFTRIHVLFETIRSCHLDSLSELECVLGSELYKKWIEFRNGTSGPNGENMGMWHSIIQRICGAAASLMESICQTFHIDFIRSERGSLVLIFKAGDNFSIELLKPEAVKKKLRELLEKTCPEHHPLFKDPIHVTIFIKSAKYGEKEEIHFFLETIKDRKEMEDVHSHFGRHERDYMIEEMDPTPLKQWMFKKLKIDECTKIHLEDIISWNDIGRGEKMKILIDALERFEDGYELLQRYCEKNDKFVFDKVFQKARQQSRTDHKTELVYDKREGMQMLFSTWIDFSEDRTENPKSSSASAHATTQTETCRKKVEKDVEVQTDLTCSSGDPALSAYFVCQNCRRHSFSNSTDVCKEYDDAKSLMEKTLGTGCEHFFDRIRANYVQLQKDLDVMRIMPYFFQNQLLESHDMEELKDCKLQRDQVDCFLLQKCLKMNQLKAYETFTYALRELNFDHILEMFQENPKGSLASAHATTQTETCRKKVEKDVEVQTDLTCSSGDPALSAYFVCQNCRRRSFSNSTDVCKEYDDAKSLMEKTLGTGCEHFFDRIRANYVQLQKDLDVMRIMPYFFQNQLLESHDMEELKDCKLQRDQVDCFLLQKCLKMNQLKAYETFTYALRELNFDHILEMFQENPKGSLASAHATTQTETCRKKVEKDVEVQTDLTCSSGDPALSAYFVCQNCRRRSFSNSTDVCKEYDDAKSLMEKTLGTGCEHFFDRIRANYVQLQKDLDVMRIMPYFFQNQLLESHDMEELKDCKLQRDQVDCFLLQKCLKMNQLKAYETFTYALRELNFDHILEMFQENPKGSLASAHATTQTETCRKKVEKDVEVQTDLTCSSGDPALSAYFVCQNCRRRSFSNSTDVCKEYDDAKSLQRAPEDEHGYTILGPRDKMIVEQCTEREFQHEEATFTIISDTKSTTDAEARDTRGLVYLTHAMSECTVTSPINENMNHPDLAALKEEVRKLEGWRPDVSESNVKEKARAWEGQQGYYFLWWHKRSKRESMKQSTRSSVSRHGRFIVSVWSKRVLLHYKILDKKDENQQRTYYVDKSFSSPSISELIETWKENGISVKEDKL